jgi:flavin reductase (DIM6/NTAB) family NADH-FMN oxidoreductase RutF
MPRTPSSNRSDRRNTDHTVVTTDDHPALDLMPRPLFVLTASYEGHRRGQLVRLVQLAATSPPTVSIALPKGCPISPLIRDSKAFGLCQIADNDEFLERKFAHAEETGFDEGDVDPFDALEITEGQGGSPLIARALACFDCRVTMHLDFDTDHEMYIAQVLWSSLNQADTDPLIRIGPHM